MEDFFMTSSTEAEQPDTAEKRTLQVVWGEQVAGTAAAKCEAASHRIPLHQKPVWLLHHHAHELQHLGAFFLHQGDETQGYAPFLIQKRRLKSYLGELNLFSFGLQCIRFLGLPHFPEETSAYDHLFASALGLKQSEGLFLESLPSNSFLWNYLQHNSVTHKLIRYAPSKTVEHFVINVPTSFDEYMTKFSSKTRSTLLRRIRKLEKAAGDKLRLERVTEEAQVDLFVENAVTVSRKTYQWHLLSLGLREPERLKAELKFLARRGWARCYLLWCNEKPIAFMLCRQDPMACYYIDVGFDPDWTQYSPGTVLQLLVLQDLFEFKKPSVFDFGTGEGEHKRFFGTSSYREADLYLLRPKPHALFACTVHRTTSAASSLAVGLLERLDLKKKIKKMVRRRSVTQASSGESE